MKNISLFNETKYVYQRISNYVLTNQKCTREEVKTKLNISEQQIKDSLKYLNKNYSELGKFISSTLKNNKSIKKSTIKKSTIKNNVLNKNIPNNISSKNRENFNQANYYTKVNNSLAINTPSNNDDNYLKYIEYLIANKKNIAETASYFNVKNTVIFSALQKLKLNKPTTYEIVKVVITERNNELRELQNSLDFDFDITSTILNKHITNNINTTGKYTKKESWGSIDPMSLPDMNQDLSNEPKYIQFLNYVLGKKCSFKKACKDFNVSDGAGRSYLVNIKYQDVESYNKLVNSYWFEYKPNYFRANADLKYVDFASCIMSGMTPEEYMDKKKITAGAINSYIKSMKINSPSLYNKFIKVWQNKN